MTFGTNCGPVQVKTNERSEANEMAEVSAGRAIAAQAGERHVVPVQDETEFGDGALADVVEQIRRQVDDQAATGAMAVRVMVAGHRVRQVIDRSTLPHRDLGYQ